MSQLTYAKTIELDLSKARDDEFYNIAGTTIVALYRDGDVYIKLDSKTNTPINLREIPKITNADFECFYVSNSPQPGKKVILVVGSNIDIDRQVLSLEELRSVLDEMHLQTINLAQTTLDLRNLFVEGTLIVGPLPDDFIHDMFINYPEGVNGTLPRNVSDRTELSPLYYMENLPEGTVTTRYLYVGEKISVGNRVEIEKTTDAIGRITIKDDSGNEHIIIGESALPDNSDGIYIDDGGKLQIGQENNILKWDSGTLTIKSDNGLITILDSEGNPVVKLGAQALPNNENGLYTNSSYLDINGGAVIVGRSALPDGSDGIYVSDGGKLQIGDSSTNFLKWDSGTLTIKSDNGLITILDSEGNPVVKLGAQALPDESSGIYSNNVWIEAIEDPETAYIIRPNGVYRKVNDQIYAVPSFLKSGTVFFDGSSISVSVTHNLNISDYDILLFPEQYQIHDINIPTDKNLFLTIRAYPDENDPSNTIIIEGYIQEDVNSQKLCDYTVDGSAEDNLGSGTININEEVQYTTAENTYYVKIDGTSYTGTGSSGSLVFQHSYSDYGQYTVKIVTTASNITVYWGDGSSDSEDIANFDHYDYTITDKHAGEIGSISVQTNTDISWAKVEGTLYYAGTSYSFSKQHYYETAGQYTITVKINYRKSTDENVHGYVSIEWGDDKYIEFIPKSEPIKSLSGSMYDGTGGTKHPLKNTQIKYYIIK